MSYGSARPIAAQRDRGQQDAQRDEQVQAIEAPGGLSRERGAPVAADRATGDPVRDPGEGTRSADRAGVPSSAHASASSVGDAARRRLARRQARSTWPSPTGRCVPSRAPAPGPPCPGPRPRQARTPSGSRLAPAHSPQAPNRNTPVTSSTAPTTKRGCPATPSPRGSSARPSVPYAGLVLVSTPWRLMRQPIDECHQRHEPAPRGDREQRHEREHRHQVALVDPGRQQEEADAQEDRGHDDRPALVARAARRRAHTGTRRPAAAHRWRPPGRAPSSGPVSGDPVAGIAQASGAWPSTPTSAHRL